MANVHLQESLDLMESDQSFSSQSLVSSGSDRDKIMPLPTFNNSKGKRTMSKNPSKREVLQKDSETEREV